MGFLDWLWGKPEENNYAMPAVPPSIAPPPASLGVPQAPRVPMSVPPTYSVESAIELMRTLPFDENPDLVLRVVRKTLRSTGVSVEDIIDSAQRREASLMANVAKERGVIEQLENEIATRRGNIDRIEKELNETRGVRERLEDAIENETKVQPIPPEVARLHAAEAAAAAKRGAGGGAPPPLPSPLDVPTTTGTSPGPSSVSAPAAKSLPPLPKPGAPSFPKKSYAPKAPTPSASHKSTKADAPPPLPSSPSSGGSAAKSEDSADASPSSLPKLSSADDTSADVTERKFSPKDVKDGSSVTKD